MAAGGAVAGALVMGALPEGDVAPPILAAPLVVYAAPMLRPVVVRPASLARARARKRGRYERARPGEAVRVVITAYCLKGETRRGRWTREGIVAADPRIFPLGRYVELFARGRYLGRFLVDDTGKNIKGARIDLWKATCGAAHNFGRAKGRAVLVPR